VGDEHFDPHYAARPHSAPFTAERPARLLTVGRLIERKGHVSVLRSLARVREVVGPLRYSIIGTGHTAGLLRATIRELGLEDTVEMRGEVGPEELLDAYRDADIFVLPNLDNPDTGDTEGFVIALGEASAHGLPVVGGRAGGTAHSVVDGETGLLVDGQNSNEVGEAVARILFEPGLAQRMGDAGRAHARDTMNWERRLPKFIELLEDEAGGETPRRTA
jgi:phosphatidylinositol alpha-1,6-mannosyltransferase